MVISVSDSSNLSNLANPSRLTQIPTASDALLVTTGVSTQRERLAEVWVIPAQTKDKKKKHGGAHTRELLCGSRGADRT